MECVHTNTQETYYYINEANTYISVKHIKTLHHLSTRRSKEIIILISKKKLFKFYNNNVLQFNKLKKKIIQYIETS